MFSRSGQQFGDVGISHVILEMPTSPRAADNSGISILQGLNLWMLAFGKTFPAAATTKVVLVTWKAKIIDDVD